MKRSRVWMQVCNGPVWKPHHGSLRLAGFTLVELLVGMVMSVILLTVAVPALSNVMVSGKLTALANALLSNLTYARSEAIKRNGRTVLCKSSTGTGCAGSGGWEQGWIVFHDADNDTVRDAGEALLLVQAALPSGFVLCGNDPVASYVSYAPTGAALKTGGAWQFGALFLIDPSTQQARKIIINSAGRVRIEKLIASSCPPG